MAPDGPRPRVLMSPMVPVGTFPMTFGGPSARKLLTQKPPFPARP